MDNLKVEEGGESVLWTLDMWNVDVHLKLSTDRRRKSQGAIKILKFREEYPNWQTNIEHPLPSMTSSFTVGGRVRWGHW